MVSKGRSVCNEKGFSFIGILLALVIIGVLIHPTTSPFSTKYFNFKAETQLKNLYSSCGLVWATSGVESMTASITGKEIEAKKCDLRTATQSPYNFRHDQNVKIIVEDGSIDGFSATAKHPQGDKILHIDSSGKII